MFKNLNDTISDIFSISDKVLKSKYTNIFNESQIKQIISIRDDFREIHEVLDEIDNESLIPSPMVNRFFTLLEDFRTLITDADSNPARTLEIIYSVVFENDLSHYRGFDYIKFKLLILSISDNFKNVRNEIRSYMSERDNYETKKIEYDNRINSSFEQINDLKRQVEATIAEKTKVLGAEALNAYSEVFDTVASDNIKKATWWQFFGFFGIVLFIIMLRFGPFGKFEAIRIDQPIFWTSLLGLFHGLLIISANIFVISYSFRQSRLLNHQYVLNKHRANVLKSFINIITTNNGQTPINDASYTILLSQVSKAIFEHTQSGYVNTVEKQNDGPFNILDVVKAFTPQKPE